MNRVDRAEPTRVGWLRRVPRVVPARRATLVIGPALRSVLGGGVSRALTLPVTALAGLLTTRLVIGSVGGEQFAFIALVLSLSAFLPFADMGVGAAVVNQTAASSDPANDPLLERTILTCVRVLVVAAATLLCIDAVITSARWWPAILGVSRSAGVNAPCGAAVALFAVALPLGLGQRLLLGLGRNGLLVALQALSSPVALLVTLVGVKTHAGLPVLVLAVPVANLLACSVQSVVARRLSGLRVRHLLRSAGSPGRHPGASVRMTAGPMLIVTLGIPLALQTDRIILAHVSSSLNVARYALALQMYAPLWSVAAAAGLSLWPVFARQAAQPAGQRLLTRAVGAFALVGIGGGVLLAVAGPVLSPFVGAGRVLVSFGLAAAFAVLLVMQSIQLPLGMSLMSEVGLRFQARCVMAMVPVSCAVSYLLGRSLGAVGPVIGSIVAIGLCQIAPGLWRTGVMRRRVRSSPLLPTARINLGQPEDHLNPLLPLDFVGPPRASVAPSGVSP